MAMMIGTGTGMWFREQKRGGSDLLAACRRLHASILQQPCTHELTCGNSNCLYCPVTGHHVMVPQRNKVQPSVGCGKDMYHTVGVSETYREDSKAQKAMRSVVLFIRVP